MKKWLLSKYFDLIFWWNRIKLERLLDNELSSYSSSNNEIYQDDTQRKYSEGIAIVKGTINSMAGTRDTKHYRQALEQVKDLLSLATKETANQKELREIMTAMSKLPEKSKKRMIEERIGHYEELRKYNEERALIKKIKQARKDHNKELHEELEQEWRNTYGKVRHPRRY